MVMSTNDQLEMFSPQTLSASPNTTSSPALEDGPWPAALLALLPTDPSGPPAAHVSLSARRDGAKVVTIDGTCGPTSFASSAPPGPLQSWENRLRARLARIGSTESPLIWEVKATKAGRLLSRLRPWTPRKSEPDSTGSRWPAPQANDAGNSSRSGDRRDELLLQGMMRWASPKSTRAGPDYAHADRPETGGPNLQTQMAAWTAPRHGDFRSGSSRVGAADMRMGGPMLPEQMTETVDLGGRAPTGSSATTARRGVSPTPAHPCWLQGFPAEWLLGAGWATRSASRRPSKSSKPSLKQS